MKPNDIMITLAMALSVIAFSLPEEFIKTLYGYYWFSKLLAACYCLVLYVLYRVAEQGYVKSFTLFFLWCAVVNMGDELFGDPTEKGFWEYFFASIALAVATVQYIKNHKKYGRRGIGHNHVGRKNMVASRN